MPFFFCLLTSCVIRINRHRRRGINIINLIAIPQVLDILYICDQILHSLGQTLRLHSSEDDFSCSIVLSNIKAQRVKLAKGQFASRLEYFTRLISIEKNSFYKLFYNRKYKQTDLRLTLARGLDDIIYNY